MWNLGQKLILLRESIIMISVTEEISLLTKQENRLHTSLDNLRGQRSKVKEHKQLEKELAVVLGKPIDLPDVCRQLPQTLKRIRRLRESGLLSRCVYTILESFGRQTYLDDFEDKLLTFMERNYGIEN